MSVSVSVCVFRFCSCFCFFFIYFALFVLLCLFCYFFFCFSRPLIVPIEYLGVSSACVVMHERMSRGVSVLFVLCFVFTLLCFYFISSVLFVLFCLSCYFFFAFLVSLA